MDRPAAHGAVLDQRLFGLRGVDLERENFTAMGTSDVGFNQELHVNFKLEIRDSNLSEATA